MANESVELMRLAKLYTERFGTSIPQDILESETPTSALIAILRAALTSGEPVKAWLGRPTSDIRHAGT